MEETHILFLQSLKAALKNEKVQWEDDISSQEWFDLFHMAEQHHLFPMIYETVYSCPAALQTGQQFLFSAKQKTVQTVMIQTIKTQDFLALYRHLVQAGIHPIVVKGIICRNMYPKPDHRISGDEDILIPADQFERCHKAMLEVGMVCADESQDIYEAYEVPYRKPGSPLHIEVHKSLFPTDSSAYGDFNFFFTDIFDKSIEVMIDGVAIQTMRYTDHLFYLICHAFKHFLHSGFGIRQVCDIVLMANQYGREIDWKRILEQCQAIHAERFTAALFQIGQKYLVFEPDMAAYPDEWRKIQVDEADLLEDLLSAGVYGKADMERVHSSTVTLNAVAAQKAGKKAGVNIWKSLFPSVKDLKGRYAYLQSKPYLLPVAWANRILNYRKEMKNSGKNKAAGSIRIGSQRVELLKEYGIIDE